MAFNDSDIRKMMEDQMGFSSSQTVGRTHSARAEVMGLSETEKNLGIAVLELVRRSGITTEKAAKKLLDESHRQVPYDTGMLYETGKVTDVTENQLIPEFEVSYDTQYAMMVHETPQNYKQGKGPYPGDHKKDHYLSDPAEEMKAELNEIVVREVVEPTIKKVNMTPRLVKKKS